MNIIVCIKQVPDSDKVTIDRETNRLNRTGVPSIINPFDENALEMAFRLKEKYSGKVTVLTMGPPQAEEALRTAIALGADEAILVSDRAFGGADTWATSYTLSAAIKKLGAYDVILFGKQAIDGDTAQVGPGVAHWLDIPVITFIKDIEQSEQGFTVKRVIEDGYEVWEVDAPAAFSVVKEANELRMPSLKGKVAAIKAVIQTWGAADLEVEPEKLGLKGSPTKVRKVFSPPVKMNREIVEGSSTEEKVRVLIHKLKERKVL
jgi:electron transfer flavoprotein beta subunit